MDQMEPLFESDASETAEESSMQELSIEDALKNMKSLQKKQKKSRIMGLCAFVLATIAGAILLFALGSALLSFLNKELSMDDIRLALGGVNVCAVISAIALILCVVTYFFKCQKKGFAVTATVLTVLMLLVCGATIYMYQYVFGEMKQDEAFNQLSDEQLYVVKMESNGEINREIDATAPTTPLEEIEGFIKNQEENNPNLEVEWEHLTDDDIPQEALDKMYTGAPQGKSYLTGDHAQIVNFALFGLDRHGSSDSIIIFSFDRVHHKLKLISIPRDSYVRIPAWGTFAKLAYPYFWGGAQWAVGTLNYNFSMNITEYITVNFEQLEDIVNMVGGVYVDLDYNEAWCLRDLGNYSVGRNLLRGDAAVRYSRLRESSSTDNEQKRTGRQREVLMSILERVQNMSLEEYPGFIRACLGMCTTSLDNEQLMELCAEVLQNNYTIEEHALIEYMDYWGGQLGQAQYFYVVYDLNRASDMLYRIIYEDLYISGYTD